MESLVAHSNTLPAVEIADIIAKPMWLMTFQEEMLYFGRETMVEPKPDITREKLQCFDESSELLAEALTDPELQKPVISTMYDLQYVYTEQWLDETNLEAADAIKIKVTQFALDHTPPLAAIAFDETNILHDKAMRIIANAASTYGAAQKVPHFLHHHIGIYDRFRRIQEQGPQLYAQHLLVHTPTNHQSLVATTFDALWREAFPMDHEARMTGETAQLMTHPIHPDLSLFVSHAYAIAEEHYGLVQAYLTTAQYLGSRPHPQTLKPFQTFISELQQGDTRQASSFWLAA